MKKTWIEEFFKSFTLDSFEFDFLACLYLLAKKASFHARPAMNSISIFWAFCLSIILSLLCGCNSTDMQFHFAALEAKQPAKGKLDTELGLKFYRITIDSKSGNSLTNLQTGYYDAGALHALFGQVSSDSAKVKSNHANEASNVIVQVDPVTGNHRIVKADKRFTIVHGANADAVAGQISAFANVDDTGKMIGGLIASAIGREQFESLYSARSKLSETQSQSTKFHKALSALATQTEAPPAAGVTVDTHIKSLVLKAIEKGLSSTGESVALPDNFDKAVAAAKAILTERKESLND